MPNSILVVDDDRFLLENLRKLLEREAYVVQTAGTGEEALATLGVGKTDLVVLDVGLPGIDGVSTCRQLRKKWNLPVLMLTARSDTMDKVIGLEVGADDYLPKPFEPAELLARVRALLRRNQEYTQDKPKESRQMTFGELTIDLDRRDALVNGAALGLTAKEFDLLAYLAQNRDRAISRDQLFETVWGYEMDFNSNSLDVYVYRLRKKLENACRSFENLKTLRGYGYKFVTES